MPELCPFCEAELDEAAIATNICSSCDSILGDFNSTIATMKFERNDPLHESEVNYSALMKTCDAPRESDTGDFFLDPQQNSRQNQISVNSRSFGDKEDISADFSVVGHLGTGGMGIVHDAVQKSIGRHVALKVINKEKTTESAIEKFCQEAAITGKLEHPNIVPIYDLGKNSNDDTFYAMKKIVGTPWSKVIEAKSLQENIDILLKVCDAIDYAHTMGVMHRDIKPENVMLGDFGEVLLTDWGLAAGTTSDSFAPLVTYEDAIAGTPAYMAPEMARGDEEAISAKSDAYLLGGILYEIITGSPPHTGKNVRECLSNAAKNVIEEPWLKSELLKTAMKAMEKKPENRFDSVKDFKIAIKTNSKSVISATTGRKHLTNAKKDGDYMEFMRSLSAFEEAIELWDGNEDARKAYSEALLAFAEVAEKNGDKALMQTLKDHA